MLWPIAPIAPVARRLAHYMSSDIHRERMAPFARDNSGEPTWVSPVRQRVSEQSDVMRMPAHSVLDGSHYCHSTSEHTMSNAECHNRQRYTERASGNGCQQRPAAAEKRWPRISKFIDTWNSRQKWKQSHWWLYKLYRLNEASAAVFRSFGLAYCLRFVWHGGNLCAPTKWTIARCPKRNKNSRE